MRMSTASTYLARATLKIRPRAMVSHVELKATRATGVRLVEVSIMPTIPTATTNLPTIIVVEHLDRGLKVA